MLELTREIVLAELPGERLNRWIAEKVMGWSIYHYDKDVPNRCYYMLVDENFDPVANDIPFTLRNGERKTEAEAWNDNRPFSTDISAAWKVVEELQGSHLYTDIRTCADFYEVWITNHANGSTTETFASPRLPEAICKASLLCVLEEGK